MMSVAGDWRDGVEGDDRSAILGDITPGRVGPAAAPLAVMVVVGAGWKDWSSSEHNTNIPLYSRRKKLGEGRGRGKRLHSR